MEIVTVSYIFFVIFFAGILQALTGFGFALLAAPLLTIATSSKEAVALVLFIGVLMKGFMVCKTWNDGQFSRIMIIFTASIVGAIPGALLIRVIDDHVLKIFIGIILLIATLMMSSDIKITVYHHRLVKTVVGFLSGFLGATTSLNGPPVVLYMMNEGSDKSAIRADLVRYFFLGNTATLGMSYYIGSLPTNHLSLYGLVSIPAILLSWKLGEKIFQSVNAARFRRLSIAVITISAVVTLTSGFYPFLSALF